jgi:hypothetical protein
MGIAAARARLSVAGVVMALVVCACSNAGPTTAPSSAVPPPSSSDRVVTTADNGRTVSIRVDERFLLQLGTDLEWTVGALDDRVIARVPGITVVRGAQGVYRGVASGETTLTATGDPACRRATPPCGAPSMVFEVHITVTP